jgi:hypothetical protein
MYEFPCKCFTFKTDLEGGSLTAPELILSTEFRHELAGRQSTTPVAEEPLIYFNPRQGGLIFYYDGPLHDVS